MDEVDERRARNTVRWASMLVDDLFDLEPGHPDVVSIAQDLVTARREVEVLQVSNPAAAWAPVAGNLLTTAAGRAEAALRARHDMTDDDLVRHGLESLASRPHPRDQHG